MPIYYTISNHEKNTKSQFNETLLLDCMKNLKHRNKEAYNRLIDVWEQLNNKTFDESFLERY